MKIISMILAFILSLFGITPAFQPVEAYTQAEWYALVADEFNLTYDLEDEDNYDIAEDDEYFEVIQACYDWNVIVGEYDADADATNFVVAKSLAAAAGLEEGIVTSYFANPFGPMQQQEVCKPLIDEGFASLYRNGIFVGEIFTHLGFANSEDKSGIVEGAKQLLEFIQKS